MPAGLVVLAALVATASGMSQDGYIGGVVDQPLS